MPSPPLLPPSRDEFDELLQRVLALESGHSDAMARNQAQDEEIRALKQQRDEALGQKQQAENQALRAREVLKDLERYVVALMLVVGAGAVVVVNDRVGDPDPRIRLWAFLGGGGGALLVLTDNAKLIGRLADKLLGGDQS